MADSPSLLDLEIRVADDREALASLLAIGSVHEGPFNQWRSWEFWAQLARRWREASPDRTPEQAREHYRRVVRALGVRRSQ